MQLSSSQRSELTWLARRENVVGFSGTTVTVRRDGGLCDAVVLYVVDAARPAPATELYGLPVELVEVGEVVGESQPALAMTKADAPAHPLVGGVSIGVVGGGTGTLGCFVRDSRNRLGVLGSGHVLRPVGAAIVQPAPTGGEGAEERIGAVTVSIHDVAWTDAAYGVVDRSVDVDLRIREIGILRGTGDAEIGETVRKFGAATGLTQGTVGDADAYVRVGPPGSPLVNLLRIDGPHLSDVGDSGSIWVNRSCTGIGLHFAGSSNRCSAWAYKLDDVLARLGLRLA